MKHWKSDGTLTVAKAHRKYYNKAIVGKKLIDTVATGIWKHALIGAAQRNITPAMLGELGDGETSKCGRSVENAR